MKTDSPNKNLQKENTNRFVRNLVFAENFMQLIERTDPSSLVPLTLGQHQYV